VHPFTVEGVTVSSTVIRKALGGGDVDRAARFLGRPYSFSGTVVRGDGRGKTIGFPTANIRPVSASKIVPAHGVYAVGVRLGNEQHYGMMNIGFRPTVATVPAETMEVHLFDFDRDIYGAQVAVSFLRRLRDERKFDSLADLVEQLGKDREEARHTVLQRPGIG
jgi:riboflavin kinase/FMN adenylyltransferase